MPSNKDRLYLALYARSGGVKMADGEDRYHWALLVGPKSDTEEDKGVRYHVRNIMKPNGTEEWVFEDKHILMMPTQAILIRIMLAKVKDADKLHQLLRQTPIRQGDEGWNCVSFVKEALSNLESSKDILGTCVLSWDAVRDAAMSYCQQKKDQHRFDGKVEGYFDTRKVPTFDLLQGKETIP